MALENMTGSNVYINAFVPTNPTATDNVSQGDNHIQGIKNCILNTFPGISAPVTIPNLLQVVLGQSTGKVVSVVQGTYVTAGNSSINVTPKKVGSVLCIEATYNVNLLLNPAGLQQGAVQLIRVGAVNQAVLASQAWSATTNSLQRIFMQQSIRQFFTTTALTAVAIDLMTTIQAAGSITFGDIIYKIEEIG